MEFVRWLVSIFFVCWLLAVGYLAYEFQALPSANIRTYGAFAAVVLFALAIFFLLLKSLISKQRRILELLAAQQQPLLLSETQDLSKKMPFAQWLEANRHTTGEALQELARIYGFAQAIYYAYSQNTLSPKETIGMPIYKARAYQMNEDLPGEVLASGKPCFIEAPSAAQAQPIESGLGNSLPKMLALLPLHNGSGQPIGLLEAGLLSGLSEQTKKQLAQDVQVLASFLQE